MKGGMGERAGVIMGGCRHSFPLVEEVEDLWVRNERGDATAEEEMDLMGCLVQKTPR